MKNCGQLHKGHRQRLKQRAKVVGVENMEIHELLELLLTYTIPYKDVNPLAHALLQKYGSFNAVLDAGYDQLLSMDGVGHETALFLSSLPAVLRRYRGDWNTVPVLRTPASVVDLFRARYKFTKYEDFYLFCMDHSFKLVKTVVVNGNKTSSITFNSHVVSSQVAAANAKYFVALHTHTCEDMRPSQADVVATKRIIGIAGMLGVDLMDHLIVTPGTQKFYSFKTNGLLDKLEKEVAESLNGLDKIKTEQLNEQLNEDAAEDTE